MNIPLPANGRGRPLLRFKRIAGSANFLSAVYLFHSGIQKIGQICGELVARTGGRLILTMSDTVWCWGGKQAIRAHFGSDLISIVEADVPSDFAAVKNLHVKGFLEEALCVAIARGRPVLSRTSRSSAHLIADPLSDDDGALDPLVEVVGEPSGIVLGIVYKCH